MTRRAATFGQELSEREVVELRLLAAGLSQREVATQLYISPNTVKTHLRATYRKLGACAWSASAPQPRTLASSRPQPPQFPAVVIPGSKCRL